MNNELLQWLQFILNLCTLAGMLYAFKRYINKPREDLAAKVAELEYKVKEHDTSLKQGNDKFRKQNNINEVFVSTMIAFINFEIAFCYESGYKNNSDLLKAKNTLEQYLAGKNEV